MDPVLTPEELDQALEAHRWTARDWARSDGAALLTSALQMVAGSILMCATGLALGEGTRLASAAISARDGGKTVNEIQRAFDRAATINDITTISGKDLEVTKEGNTVVVTFRYEKKVHLFYNVSLLIEYAGSTEP